MKDVLERLSYLQIELSLGTEKRNFKNTILKTESFLEDYSGSKYESRIKYILGSSLIDDNQIKKGKILFNEMLEDEKISSPIKEMIRSDLSLEKIREKI